MDAFPMTMQLCIPYYPYDFMLSRAYCKRVSQLTALTRNYLHFLNKRLDEVIITKVVAKLFINMEKRGRRASLRIRLKSNSKAEAEISRKIYEQNGNEY